MSEDTRPESDREQESSTQDTTEDRSWPRVREELDRLIGWVVYLLGLTFVLMMLGFLFEGCTITTSTHEYSVGIIGNGGPHMTARPLSDANAKQDSKQGSTTTP